VWTETPISMTWWPTLHVFLVGKRVVGDGRHLPEERPAVLDQPVSNPLAFSGSPHATLRFPKLPRRGCETTAGSTEGWSNHLAFRIAGELWRRRDERTPFGPSRRDSDPCFSLERASPWLVISASSLPGATARCHSQTAICSDYDFTHSMISPAHHVPSDHGSLVGALGGRDP